MTHHRIWPLIVALLLVGQHGSPSPALTVAEYESRRLDPHIERYLQTRLISYTVEHGFAQYTDDPERFCPPSDLTTRIPEARWILFVDRLLREARERADPSVTPATDIEPLMFKRLRRQFPCRTPQ